VPRTGLEASTLAYAKIIDEVNKLPLSIVPAARGTDANGALGRSQLIESHETAPRRDLDSLGAAGRAELSIKCARWLLTVRSLMSSADALSRLLYPSRCRRK
jgi:hypothetical protein